MSKFRLTEKQKDILYWIAATLFVLIGLASCIQIVDQVTGEGWNPILWVIQMVFGAWFLLAAVLWVWDNLIVKPIRWLLIQVKPEYDYPVWYRKYFLKKNNRPH